jgi:hypothetical protein
MVSPDRSVAQVSGRGPLGSFGPLVQTLYKARRTAIARMSAEFFDLRQPDDADASFVRALQAAGEANDALLGSANPRACRLRSRLGRSPR